MIFKPVKCNTMQITRKWIKKINVSYTSEGMVLDNVEKIKYLGMTIINDLTGNTHVHRTYRNKPKISRVSFICVLAIVTNPLS